MLKQALGRMTTLSKKIGKTPYDCLDLLRSDHVKIELLLVRLRMAKKPDQRAKIFSQLQPLLEIHMKLEEDLFYPESARVPKLEHLIEQSQLDHQSVRTILKDLDLIDPDARRYGTLVTRLILNVEKHVIREEDQVFPEIKTAMESLVFDRLTRMIFEKRKALEDESRPQAA